jgi:hypothetical protein
VTFRADPGRLRSLLRRLACPLTSRFRAQIEADGGALKTAEHRSRLRRVGLEFATLDSLEQPP